jgi:hypothetical protein
MNPIPHPRIALPFFALVLLLPLCANAAAQGEAAGIRFEHGDWEVVCDNTLTCRIAGYCAEEDLENGCATVLITRAAGPGAPLAGQARLADDGGERKNPSVLTLRYACGVQFVKRFSAESAARANSGVCPFLSRASLTRTESRNGGTQS